MRAVAGSAVGRLAAPRDASAAPDVEHSVGAEPAATACIVRHRQSLSLLLSRRLALLTMLVLATLSIGAWTSVKMMIVERNQQDVARRGALLAEMLRLESRSGSEAVLLARLASDSALRGEARLQLWRADGRSFYADPVPLGFEQSRHVQSYEFSVDTPGLPARQLRARLDVDFARDAQTGQRWAIALVLVTLLAGAVVAGGSYWQVRRTLAPLRDLAAQTRAITPRDLSLRLRLEHPAEELEPWIEQFNALMQRLERAYVQLDAFNADVAHELRTPLANLVGATEVALARGRSEDDLRETLLSNLEEVQRLSALVNDMLFLAQADRGAQARRQSDVDLHALAEQVAEFHEAAIAEAGLQWRVVGEVQAAVDAPLIKRALSNLIGNATRYAERGSDIVVQLGLDAAAAGQPGTLVRIEVGNRGPVIESQQIERLFDRFYRVEASRACPESQHFGLGLSIVAAIARMHGGQVFAHSLDGWTRVGMTIPAASEPTVVPRSGSDQAQLLEHRRA
jgi:two-component system heavy metal sensor histidine kinase CusS